MTADNRKILERLPEHHETGKFRLGIGALREAMKMGAVPSPAVSQSRISAATIRRKLASAPDCSVPAKSAVRKSR